MRCAFTCLRLSSGEVHDGHLHLRTDVFFQTNKLPFACTHFRTPQSSTLPFCRYTADIFSLFQIEIKEKNFWRLKKGHGMKYLKLINPAAQLLYSMWFTKQKGFWEFINNLRYSHNEGLVRTCSLRTSSVTDVHSCTEKNTKRISALTFVFRQRLIDRAIPVSLCWLFGWFSYRRMNCDWD